MWKFLVKRLSSQEKDSMTHGQIFDQAAYVLFRANTRGKSSILFLFHSSLGKE